MSGTRMLLRLTGVMLALAPAGRGATLREQNLAAWQAFQARDFAQAERLAAAAWEAAEGAAMPSQAVFAAANKAAVAAVRGRLDEAHEWSLRAEQRLAAAGSRETRGRLLAARALIETVRGEEDAAQRSLALARDALGENDWRLRLLAAEVGAYAHGEIGEGYQEVIRLRDAAAAAGDVRRQALAQLALAWVEGLSGDSVPAFDRARELFAAAGQHAVLPVVDHGISAVAIRAGHFERAREAIERGLAAARAGGDRRSELILMNDLTFLHHRAGDAARAREADRAAGRRLAEVAEEVRSGRLEDSLLLDLRQLHRMRYVHQPQMVLELFVGFFDQLAVEPVDGPSEAR